MPADAGGRRIDRAPEDKTRPEPVAICRLKRAAADFKDDIRDRLPKPVAIKNGKRVALIGAMALHR